MISSLIKTIVYKIPHVELREKVLLCAKSGYWPNLKNPQSFNEKIVWRKLYCSNPLFINCTDKLAVRDFVQEKIGGAYLVPLLYSGESITEQQLISLGDDIVVKATHDSGSAQLIRKNSQEIANAAVAAINKRLDYDFGAYKNELWYSQIPPRVLVEKLLLNEDGEPVCDIKLFVLRQTRSKPPKIIIEVTYDRGTPTETKVYYDTDGSLLKHKGEIVKAAESPHDDIPFPHLSMLDELLSVTRTLSKDFDHVRVDLYCTHNKVYFGELTFSTAAGRTAWIPKSYDFVLGNCWTIDRTPYPSQQV